MGNIAVGEPFTFWAMDYMGPLPETSRSNQHILVVVEHFTKWCEAFATPHQKNNHDSTTFDQQNIFAIRPTRGIAL